MVESTEHRDAFEWNAVEGPAPSGSLRVELELLDRVSTASDHDHAVVWRCLAAELVGLFATSVHADSDRLTSRTI